MNTRPTDTSRRHFYASLVKSVVRIVAGGCTIAGNFVLAGTFIILAEIFGVFVEVV